MSEANAAKNNWMNYRSLRPIGLLIILATAYGWWYLNAREFVAKKGFILMGTSVEITVVGPHYVNLDKLIDNTRVEMQKVVDVMNAYDPDSFVSRLNDLPSSTPLKVQQGEEVILDVLDTAHKVSELSDGAFDITFASVGRYWRFDPTDPRLPSDEEVAVAKERIDYRNVVVDREAGTVTLLGDQTRIGLGGIAKGKVVDVAIRYLRTHGADGALVNAGGDMFGFGTKPGGESWKIGLRHPRQQDTLMTDNISIGGRNFGDFAVVTSGDYERSFIHDGIRYHHIIDPRTGMPSSGLSSVTVFGVNAEWADAFATAIFVLGADKGLDLAERLQGFEAIIITDDLKVLATKGLAGLARGIELKEAGDDKAIGEDAEE